jgi:hypothetical protein
MSDATTPTSPRSRWFKLVWIVPVVVVVVAAITVGAQLLRATPVVHSFLTPYPGYSKLPAWAPVGFPAWLEWQHFLSAFFIVFIIRTGWQVHTTTRAEAYWTRNNRGLLKTIRAAGPYPAASVVSPRRRRALRSQRHRLLRADLRHLAMGSDCPDPVGCLSQRNLGRHPVRVTSLADRRWLVKLQRPPAAHVFRDRFHRSAPGIFTGLRMVPGLAARWERFDRIYPVTAARKLHYPVFIYFIAFIVVHVTLVLATGALRNLNHMYGGSDRVNWVGFSFFAGSVVLMVGGWFAARPLLIASVARLSGRVGR